MYSKPFSSTVAATIAAIALTSMPVAATALENNDMHPAPTPLSRLIDRAAGDCYTRTPWLNCVKPLTEISCGDSGSQAMTCACSQNTALFACYTSNCESDQYSSSYQLGLDACRSVGLGGGGGGGGGGAPLATATPTSGAGSGGNAAGTGTVAAGASAASNTSKGGGSREVSAVGNGAMTALVVAVGAWVSGVII